MIFYLKVLSSEMDPAAIYVLLLYGGYICNKNRRQQIKKGYLQDFFKFDIHVCIISFLVSTVFSVCITFCCFSLNVFYPCRNNRLSFFAEEKLN